MMTHTKRVMLLFIAVVSSTVLTFAPLMTQTAYAAAEDPGDQLERWIYYRGMRACLEKPDWGRTAEIAGQDDQDGSRTASEINDGHLLPGGYPYQNSKEGFGYIGKDIDNDDSNDGTVECSDGSIWVRGAQLFGFAEVINLVCAMNDAAEALGTGNKIDPEGDAGDCDEADSIRFHHVEDSGSAFQEMLTKALENPAAGEHGGDGDRPSFDFNNNESSEYTYKALLYLLGKRSLEAFCGGSLESANANDSYDGDDQAVSVYIVQSDGTIKESGIGDAGFSHSYAITKKDKESDNVNDVYFSNGGSRNSADDRNCGDMARWTREGARDYAAYIKLNPEAFEEENEDGGTGGSTEPVCSAGALGWVFCPLVDFISSATQDIAGLIESQLVYPALLNRDVPEGRAIQAIWGVVLGIANVALVIAFLIVIFSQATSVGISAYGIKRMLPRVIAAAILMNLSFYLCAAAVDIANIVGVSIKDIVGSGMRIIDGIEPAADVQNGASDAQTWAAAIVGILGLGLAVATGAIFLLLPVIVAALMAVLTALLVIAARQVIVTLLIIVAPLAILAWILPNTESWFTKWRKLFTSMLLMFPLVMAIFYGSLLMSKLIMVTGSPGGDGDPEVMTNIIALAVLTVPLFSLPFIMKSAGGVLDRLGVMVNNRNKGLIDRTRNKANEWRGNNAYQRGKVIRKQARQDYKNRQFTDRLSLANKTLADYTAENGGKLTTAQYAAWTRAQATKGQAGGAAEVARMTGRGAMKGVAKLPDGPGGALGAARDGTLLAGAYAAGAAGKLPGGGARTAEQHALVRAAQAQEAKAFNERVQTYLTSYERGGAAGADTSAGGHLEREWHQAISTGNQEQAAAVITRLSGLGGGGRDRVAKLVQRTQVSDSKMRDAITKSVAQDNYGALVGKRGDLAKGGYDASGKWEAAPQGKTPNIAKVSSEQLATQDLSALQQHFQYIPQVEAARIINDQELRSKVTGAKELAILEAAANGQANPYPPTPDDLA